jgi:hypothetical protein
MAKGLIAFNDQIRKTLIWYGLDKIQIGQSLDKCGQWTRSDSLWYQCNEQRLFIQKTFNINRIVHNNPLKIINIFE